PVIRAATQLSRLSAQPPTRPDVAGTPLMPRAPGALPTTAAILPSAARKLLFWTQRSQRLPALPIRPSNALRLGTLMHRRPVIRAATRRSQLSARLRTRPVVVEIPL